MATTVTYKGSTIATVNNNTKTLKTAGTMMEDDVTLVDVSSSGGLTTVTILPSQSVTATTQQSNGNYSVYLDNISENLIAGTSYLVTIDGDAYICHADTAWDSVYAGDVEVIWGDPSNALYPFMLGSYANNRTEFGYGDNNAHTVKIERVVSFSAPELISKSITANGTYDPADDNADGYSEVAVAIPAGTAGTPTATKSAVSNHALTVTPSVTNVGGVISSGTINGTAVSVSASELVSGSETKTANGTYDVTNLASLIVNVTGGTSNIVTGTFKGTTTGAAMDVTLNYSGSGYPIAVIVYPSGGMYGNSTFNDLVQRYAIGQYIIIRCNTDTAPGYQGGSTVDIANILFHYKSSTSNSSSYSANGSTKSTVYRNSDASVDAGKRLLIRSATKMSVFIASTSYGFAANIDYKYCVIYSS